MANPDPAGGLSSSAGVRTTAIAQLRAALPHPSMAGDTMATFTAGGQNPSSAIFAGLVVAILGLAYWYRRIL